MTKVRNFLVAIGLLIAVLVGFTNMDAFTGDFWTSDRDPETVTLRAMWTSGNWVQITYKVKGINQEVHTRTSPWVRQVQSTKDDAVSMRVYDQEAYGTGSKVTCQIIRGSNVVEDIRDDGGSARCHEGIDFEDVISGG